MKTLRQRLNLGWFATWISFQGASLTVLAAYVLSALAAEMLELRAK